MALFIEYKLKISKYINKLLTVLMEFFGYSNRQSFSSRSQYQPENTLDSQTKELLSSHPIVENTVKNNAQAHPIIQNDQLNEQIQRDGVASVDYSSDGQNTVKLSKFDEAILKNAEKQSELSHTMANKPLNPMFKEKSELTTSSVASDTAKQISDMPTQILVDTPISNQAHAISKEKTQLLPSDDYAAIEKETKSVVKNDVALSKEKTQISANLNKSEVSEESTKILKHTATALSKEKTQMLFENKNAISEERTVVLDAKALSKEKTQLLPSDDYDIIEKETKSIVKNDVALSKEKTQVTVALDAKALSKEKTRIG